MNKVFIDEFGVKKDNSFSLNAPARDIYNDIFQILISTGMNINADDTFKIYVTNKLK